VDRGYRWPLTRLLANKEPQGGLIHTLGPTDTNTKNKTRGGGGTPLNYLDNTQEQESQPKKKK